MSPTHTRRRFLQRVGIGVIVGPTGCIRPGGPDEETTHARPQGDGDETVYFERRIEVGIGETEMVQEAFTVSEARRLYEITATLEPFVDGGHASETGLRQHGFIFAAWERRRRTKTRSKSWLETAIAKRTNCLTSWCSTRYKRTRATVAISARFGDYVQGTDRS